MNARALAATVVCCLACSDATGLNTQGLDLGVIDDGIEQVVAGEYGDVLSLLVYRHDQLVVEEYFHGTSRRTRASVESVTKSVTSALVGMALAGGTLPDGLDTPLLSFFPEYPTVESPSAWKDSIRIEDALTMTSGLRWDEWTLEYTHPLNSWNRMISSPDWTKFVLDRASIDPPGTRFVYNTGGALLLSRVIEQATGLTASEYAEQALFGPLGIDDWLWPSSPEGHSITGDDLQLTPPEMGKIGLLLLHRGRWGDQQVVPADWVDLSTSRHLGYADGLQKLEYAYLWWRFRDDLTVAPALGINDAYFAWGNGGQFIIVVPHLDMVVVMTGANFSTGDVDSAVQLELFRDYILPAVSD